MVLMLSAVVITARHGAASRTLRVDVLSARRAEPGETIAIAISARDNSGTPTAAEVDFGDGHRSTSEIPAGTACKPTDARSEKFDFEHTYETAGVYTIKSVVTSGGCGAGTERTSAIRTIEVKALRR